MKITTLFISILVALIIGTGAGFVLGKVGGSGGADTKKLQSAISMMKEQSSIIQKMGDMMISSGLSMQEHGVEHKDDELKIGGKDLVAVGKKYMEENVKLEKEDASMKMK